MVALANFRLRCEQTNSLACYMVQKTDECPATYRHITLRFLQMKLLGHDTVVLVAEMENTDV
jgi:hypothetical protein